MAHAAGAAVTRNKHREIGWFPVTRADQVQSTVLRDVLPPVFEAFHWHGDTFDLPVGAVPLGASQGWRASSWTPMGPPMTIRASSDSNSGRGSSL
jgi:GMP synthase-like glutamine amidotransferase